MNAIDVSIIVPVYKGVRFLREALESVRAQTFRDWECICVDDGSQDGSGPLLDEIAATDSRFVAVHQTNGGTSAARNAALKLVRGRFVMFLDEDDVYHPEMVETLVRAAEKTNADIVGCRKLEFAESERPSFTDRPPAETEWETLDKAGVRRAASQLDDGIPFSVWLNVYRADLAKAHEFPKNVRVEQDMAWHYGLLPQVSRYVKLPFRGYAWRSSAAGGLNNPDAESMISWTHSFRRLMQETVPALDFSQDERARFVRQAEYVLLSHVWDCLKRGVRMTENQRARLGDGLRQLENFGISLHHRLGHRLLQRLKLRRLLNFKRAKIFGGRRYDFITSLGDNCAVAAFLRHFRLREMSGPFDWSGGCPKGLSLYAHFFETNFADFLVRENIVRMTDKSGFTDDKNCDFYKDKTTDWLFLHDFRIGTNFAEEFEIVKRKYDRRITRFMKRMSAGGRILLVHSARYAKADAELARETLRRIRAVFKNDKIDLLLIVNDPDALDLNIAEASDGVIIATGECFSPRFKDFWGNVPLLCQVLELITYRYQRWTAFRDWCVRTKGRIRASFILDREKRKAYRRKFVNNWQ